MKHLFFVILLIELKRILYLTPKLDNSAMLRIFQLTMFSHYILDLSLKISLEKLIDLLYTMGVV